MMPATAARRGPLPERKPPPSPSPQSPPGPAPAADGDDRSDAGNDDDVAPAAPPHPGRTGAVPQFLASFGEETTDVLDTPAVASGGVKPERQLILTVLAGPQMGLSRVLDRPELVLGRGEGSDLLLADQGLSRRHCRLVRDGGQLYIEDLESSNGTFVDGQQVSGRIPLAEGARIHLGRHTVLSLSRRDALEQLAARQLYESS